MRKGICHHLFVVVLCLGVLSAAVRAQEDVNEPWDPAEHFRPFWESVELEAKLCNPVEEPDQDPNTQRRLVIQGAVEMIDYDLLIGVTRCRRQRCWSRWTCSTRRASPYTRRERRVDSPVARRDTEPTTD